MKRIFVIVLILALFGLAALAKSTMTGGGKIRRAAAAAEVYTPYATRFNGSTYIEAGTNATLKTNPISVSVWLMRTVSGAVHFFFSNGTRDGGSRGLHMFVNSTDTIYLIANGTGEGVINSTATITDTNWHHIAGTYSNNVGYIYLDGIQVAYSGAMASGGNIIYGSDTNRIGMEGGPGLMRGLNGAIDEPVVYGRVLTSNEVFGIYSGGTPVRSDTITSGAVGAWHLDEGTGTSDAPFVGSISGSHVGAVVWTNGVVQ